MSNSLWPYELYCARILCPWDFPGKNTGVRFHAFLQGLFLTQELNPRLLYIFHGYVNSLSLRHLGNLSELTQFCPTLCNPMDCSTPGLPVHHLLPELAQNHVHWVADSIQPSHSLLSPSPPAFNHSQHQGVFQWVSSLHQVAKVLEFQLQHYPFQRIFRTDFI